MKVRSIFIMWVITVTAFHLHAQENQYTDSMVHLLTSATPSSRIDILIKLTEYYRDRDMAKALKTAKKALSESIKLNDDRKLAAGLNNYGILLEYSSDFGRALKLYRKALQLAEKANDSNLTATSLNNICVADLYSGNLEKAAMFGDSALKIYRTLKDKEGIAKATNNLGQIYTDLNDYPKALKHFLECLRCDELSDNKTGIANSLNNIGMVCYKQGNYPQALKYFKESVHNFDALKNERWMKNPLNNIAMVYMRMKRYEDALMVYKKTVAIDIAADDRADLAISYNNIGSAYRYKRDYPRAMEYFEKAYKIRKEIGDKKGLIYTCNNLGKIYFDLDKYVLALKYFREAENIATELKIPEELSDIYDGLASYYRFLNKSDSAYDYLRMAILLRDSILNAEKNRQLVELQTRFETEKKEKENELLKKEKALQKSEINRQRNFIVFIGSGLGLVVLLAFFIFRGYLHKKRANVALQQKNETITLQKTEIEKQKELIEEKNRSITDSIDYAKRIQDAILPSIENIRHALPEIFILYKPKDIICGDFYFFSKVGERAIIAMVDCTGHGVPGALMCMIGNDLLHDIVSKFPDSPPAQILEELDRRLIAVLNPDGKITDVQDGMDIALVKLQVPSPKSQIQSREKGSLGLGACILQYAGANRPLLIIRQSEIIEFKPDTKSIGGFGAGNKKFTNHEVSLFAGDMMYMFSDGFADQHGGERNKKFMTKNFKESLRKVSGESISIQEKKLNNVFQEWKRGGEQTDDVTVIGIGI